MARQELRISATHGKVADPTARTFLGLGVALADHVAPPAAVAGARA